MIADGERSGALTRDKIILDATSGNTGIAYAMIGAARGYRVRLCVPENVTPERKRILSAFGAEIVFTDPMEGSDGAILTRQGDVRGEPGRCTSIRTSTTTPATGARTTTRPAPEIIEQTGGRITHFVAGLGTSGTFVGAGRRLREFNPAIRLISVQPDSPLHGLEGLKHMDTAIVPGIYDPALADEDIGVEHRGGVRADAPAGAGGAVRRASRAARTSPARCAWPAATSNAVIVVVFCDGGEKYLSERFWDEELRPARARAEWRSTLQPGVADAIRAPRRRDVSERVLRRAHRPRRRGHGTFALPNTTEEGPRRRFLVRPTTTARPRQRARRSWGRAARVLPLASGPSGAAVAVRSRPRLAVLSYIIVSVRAACPRT